MTSLVTIGLWLNLALLSGASQAQQPTTGPLRALSANPRYFTDGSGKAIYLTGSHEWDSFQDGIHRAMDPFDFPRPLDFLGKYNHNFIRLWVWESAGGPMWGGVAPTPMPYERTGPGEAFDGRPRFDLTRFNQAYSDRLSERTMAARDRGIYVGIMLFEGVSADRSGL